MIYILDITRTTKKMLVNELRDFIFENCYKRIGCIKEINHYSMKRLKRKYLLLLASKLRKVYLILVMLKNTINHL